jgi:opacity protein-like surface antigen
MSSSRAGLAVVAVLLLAPVASGAQPVSGGGGPDTYFQLHAGAVFPQGDDLDGFDTGFSVGGTFGARFTRQISIEGEVAYWQATVSEAGVDRRVAVMPLTASLRLRVPVSFAELSAFGGAGLHLAWYTVRDATGTSTVEATEDDATFGFHVGAALALPLSPTILAGAEARYTVLSADFAGTDVQLDGLRVALTLTYHF